MVIDSALKKYILLVLDGLSQSPAVDIVSLLYRIGMAQMGPFLLVPITSFVLVRGIF